MADSAEDLLELARWFLGADLPQTARSLVLEASLHFGELRDERGLADCLLFLADIAQTQRQWDKAHEFARMAADVSARMEDLDREIASRAVAAFCLYRLEDFPWAEKAALRCLNCGEGQHPSRPLLIACFVRAACCEQRGDLLGKLGAMSGFLQVFPALSGVEDLIPLRDSFQRALTPVH
jgi:hypothetical protein